MPAPVQNSNGNSKWVPMQTRLLWLLVEFVDLRSIQRWITNQPFFAKHKVQDRPLPGLPVILGAGAFRQYGNPASAPKDHPLLATNLSSAILGGEHNDFAALRRTECESNEGGRNAVVAGCLAVEPKSPFIVFTADKATHTFVPTAASAARRGSRVTTDSYLTLRPNC